MFASLFHFGGTSLLVVANVDDHSVDAAMRRFKIASCAKMSAENGSRLPRNLEGNVASHDPYSNFQYQPPDFKS